MGESVERWRKTIEKFLYFDITFLSPFLFARQTSVQWTVEKSFSIMKTPYPTQTNWQKNDFLVRRARAKSTANWNRHNKRHESWSDGILANRRAVLCRWQFDQATFNRQRDADFGFLVERRCHKHRLQLQFQSTLPFRYCRQTDSLFWHDELAKHALLDNFAVLAVRYRFRSVQQLACAWSCWWSHRSVWWQQRTDLRLWQIYHSTNSDQHCKI